MLSHTSDSTFFVKTSLLGLLSLVLYQVFKRVTRYRSLAYLPGPPPNGYIFGNIKDTYGDEKAVIFNQWIEKYGRVFASWALFMEREVYLADLKGVAHVLRHDDIYEKPADARFLLSRITGHGETDFTLFVSARADGKTRCL
ncbi:hypothetical protein V5O48_003816 [Marasmius crinis-equi]|uniref:Cytochrome P450 n=1 Tax=Marasmius crinis-equi TaxID=585013 RepID=A0ABR3FRU1_9AGAR